MDSTEPVKTFQLHIRDWVGAGAGINFGLGPKLCEHGVLAQLWLGAEAGSEAGVWVAWDPIKKMFLSSVLFCVFY